MIPVLTMTIAYERHSVVSVYGTFSVSHCSLTISRARASAGRGMFGNRWCSIW